LLLPLSMTGWPAKMRSEGKNEVDAKESKSSGKLDRENYRDFKYRIGIRKKRRWDRANRGKKNSRKSRGKSI
jgi:hypothetical protein